MSNDPKLIIMDMLHEIWVGGNLDALDRYWTADCHNHAARAGDRIGLTALRSYHEELKTRMADFTDLHVVIEQQIAEDDRVVTQFSTNYGFSGGIQGAVQPMRLETIRIDRLRDGKIAEHWSLSDPEGGKPR
jgi:predicted ester cyclase